jgi:hypothetical protein
MGMNHKVPFRSEANIAAIAARCWQLSRQSRPYTFDVVGFIKDKLVAEGIDTVVQTRGRKKGKLAIIFFDRESIYDDPAYVVFTPGQHDNYVMLYVDRKVWRLAELGDSFACEIIAHEIGHILLHDHYANAFSTGSDQPRLFAGTSKEDFAEWQAITFAKHLLIPDHAVRKFGDDCKILAAVTNTTAKLVSERLMEARTTPKMRFSTYEGDFCRACGNFTLLREGLGRQCDTCGKLEKS